jgi:hypothetical protein
VGYTHYWKNREFTAAEWAAMRDAAQRIAARASGQRIKLAGWDGAGRPVIDADEIALNGRGDESYESFRITRNAGDDFCKTARRPYDAVVVALLTVAARVGALTWTSDGDSEDHEAGIALARELPTRSA